MTYSDWSNRPSLQRPNIFLLFLVTLIVIGVVTLNGDLPLLSRPDKAAASLTAVNPGRWPLAFVPNAGQSNSAVHYQAYNPGANLFFTSEGLTLAWGSNEEGQSGRSLGLNFVGVNHEAVVVGQEAQLGTVNYMSGNDSAYWQTGLPTYGLLTYEALYPGIGLTYQGQGQSLAAVFRVETGANPAQIGWQFAGVSPSLDESGALQLVPEGVSGETAVTLTPPQAQQEVNGRTVPVTAAFHLDENGRVRLTLAEYDKGQPLAISTVMSYAPLGGPTDYLNGIDVDENGRIYVTGSTTATIFPLANAFQPTNNGFYDVFVTVFAPDGQSLVYSTFLGGSDFDQANSIAVDDNGRAFITGETYSGNFPLANPYQSTPGGAFVTVFAPNGQSLEYSTYLSARAFSIALDDSGRAYVTGEASSNLPLVNPYQATFGGGVTDAFVTIFAPDGQSLEYSTYWGADEDDTATDITIDGNGQIYITGSTDRPDPLFYYDPFITVFAADGQSLVYSDYFTAPDTSSTYPWSIAVDGNNRAYVVGKTSGAIPLVNPFQPIYGGDTDAFLIIFSSTGQVVYGTYLGGNELEEANNVLVDGNGRAYVAGWSKSPNFPLANPYQPALDGFYDAFVTIFAPDGQSLDYSTYLGGSVDDLIESVALGEDGRIYTAGYTTSPDFPLVNPFQTGSSGQFVSVFASDGQSLDYSTLLYGAYPPTSVDVSGFGGTGQETANWLWLLAGLLALFAAAVFIVRFRSAR